MTVGMGGVGLWVEFKGLAGFFPGVSALSHVAFTDLVKDTHLSITFMFSAWRMHLCVVTMTYTSITCFLHITHPH